MTESSVPYGYFGPRGTFTQMALASWLGDDAALAAARPYPTVASALAGVRAGEVARAVVPIENSVEGGVSATLDALNSRDPLVILGEVLVPITFVLAAPAGRSVADLRAIGTHSHAWSQVRRWMADHLPDAVYAPTLSTAAAAEGLADGAPSRPGDRPPYDAAVCAPMAASVFGLETLASDIGDNASAVTRFVVVARPGELAEPSGADKTTLVIYQHDDHPGGLLELLEQFAARGINMTRLESRPTGAAMGRYCFSLDFEGHVAEERVGETLMGLKRVCADVRFLGSYRRADGRAVEPTAPTTDDAYVDARAWLRSLRGGE